MNDRSWKKAISLRSRLSAELWGFMRFIGEILWVVCLAALLITGFIVAVEHSFLWGVVILAVVVYLVERSGRF